MQFVLTGFTHEMGSRVFAFERIGDDRVRTSFTVRTDLDLIRRYGIRLQELPLMCQGILEQRSEGEENHSLTFTEGNAKDSAAARDAAAQKSKSKRKQPTETLPKDT